MFEISALRHRFSDARNAIDAVSAFEASTLDNVQYDIRINMAGWVVECRNDQNELLGNLRPVDV